MFKRMIHRYRNMSRDQKLNAIEDFIFVVFISVVTSVVTRLAFHEGLIRLEQWLLTQL